MFSGNIIRGRVKIGQCITRMYIRMYTREGGKEDDRSLTKRLRLVAMNGFKIGSSLRQNWMRA